MASIPPHSRLGGIRRGDPPLGPLLITRPPIITHAILFLRRVSGIHIHPLSTSPRNALTSSRLKCLGLGFPFPRSPLSLGIERPHDEVLVPRETGRRRQCLFRRWRETSRDGSQRGGSGRLRRSHGSWVHDQRARGELVGRPDGCGCWWKWRGWGRASGDGAIGREVLPDGFVWIWKRFWRSRWIGW